MKRLAYLALIHACSLGCLAIDTPRATDGGNGSDQKCPPDLATPSPPAKCAAAKGLAGDNLLCVDFNDPELNGQMLADPPPSKLAGWNFVADCGSRLWEIKGGRLQIKDFNLFAASSCAFSMALINLNDADKQKYKSITLALIQKTDLDPGAMPANQSAQIYNGVANLAYLLSQTSGTQPEQQVTLTIDKDTIPAPMKYMIKYLIQVSSVTAQNKQGLQISSIAVMGNTQ